MSSSRAAPAGALVSNRRAAKALSILVILGVFAGGILLAFLLIEKSVNPLFVGGLVLGLGVLVLSLQHASNQNALLAAVAAGGLLGFFSLPTGTQSRIPLSLVITLAIAGVWALQILTKQAPKPILRPSPVNGAVLAFVIANVFSFVWSTLIRDPLVWMPFSFTMVQLAALVVNCLLPLVVLLALNKIDDMRFWQYAVWLAILIGAFGIWSEILGLPTVFMTRNGMRGLTPAWAGGLAFALLLFQRKLSWPLRGLLVLVVAGFVWRNLILNTVWLSGWLPMVVIMTVIVWFRSKRLFAIALVIALVAMTHYGPQIYQSVVQSNLDEGSGNRVMIWELSLQHVMAHPLFGSGPAGYAAYYMNYHPAEAHSTHNNFFDVLAQTGFVGLLLFLYMMLRLGLVGLSNVRFSATSDDGFLRAFAVTTVAGVPAVMAAMMLGDWVLPFAYNQTITGFDHAIVTWLFLGGIASMDWMIRQGRLGERGIPGEAS